ncbi:HlyD family secretion protein [Singulisphaera sp. GP187]|uniref:efflux RND transporter periplasmic adaptor subunit n=1 Tax=Singulisphaera sp. GP187 TaxID=1882752 RepID=UPI000929409E|nr:HlyD family efflux transporter periplasmic adaptor subunit [Singulisphaera sp. GP187]SIO66724.1 HlyD family secretion protein [Singulisphaera sp. GP187]
MMVRGWTTALLGLSLVASTTRVTHAQQVPDSAKVESIPLELKSPDRYQIPSLLEPIRRVTITAPSDNILRSLELPVGSSVRDRQEIAQLDRAEALARVKIADANVKEMQATLALLKQTPNAAVAQAQLEAAQARAELATLDLDRCTLRAPFAGRLIDVAVSPGQFLPKGAKVAELADDTSLRVLIPLERTAATVGSTVKINVEGQVIAGKVQASLPLPETLAPLRELATAFTAAWVILPNEKGELEPGQRALSPSLPTSTLATIPARALHQPAKGTSGGGSHVQVIRNEYVTNIPVRILGNPGPERVQVTGLFRPMDALVVSSSVPLIAGTLIRFSGAAAAHGGVEPTNPDPAEGGEIAGITPPRTGSRGSSGASTKSRASSPAVTRVPPATAPATPKGAAPPPF